MLDKIWDVFSLLDLPARKFGGVPKETEIKERGENPMYLFKCHLGKWEKEVYRWDKSVTDTRNTV
jgi:hypothetical protein